MAKLWIAIGKDRYDDVALYQVIRRGRYIELRKTNSGGVTVFTSDVAAPECTCQPIGTETPCRHIEALREVELIRESTSTGVEA